MIITLTRSGGFTGIPFTKTIDTKTLVPEKASEIEALVMQEGVLSSIKEKQTSKPDRFTYTLSIEDQSFSNTVKLNETSLSPYLQKLIDYIKNC